MNDRQHTILCIMLGVFTVSALVVPFHSGAVNVPDGYCIIFAPPTRTATPNWGFLILTWVALVSGAAFGMALARDPRPSPTAYPTIPPASAVQEKFPSVPFNKTGRAT